jgi:hypothetical protein
MLALREVSSLLRSPIPGSKTRSIGNIGAGVATVATSASGSMAELVSSGMTKQTKAVKLHYSPSPNIELRQSGVHHYRDAGLLI